MFDEKDKSSFKYWFAHWCSYNMTALNLNAWKFKYLFHDIEKPWLKLFWGDYKKVRKWHREHNRHHWTYKDKNNLDYEAMVIDWECSRYTKKDSPLTARELYEYTITTRLENGTVSKEIVELLKNNIPQVLKKLGL